jgi:hypothetical protein
MKLSRIGVGATLALGVFTAWLGACGSSSQACGVGGVLNGTCQSGSTCPAGSSVIEIVDPFDMCPTSYNPGGSQAVCCTAPGDAAPVQAGDSGTGSSPDSTTVMPKMDATVPVDGNTTPDVVTTTPDTSTPVDTGTPDTAVPVDTGAPDTGVPDTGPADGGHLDGAHPDAARDAAIDSGCGSAQACATVASCPVPSTSCIVASCASGCCSTNNAAAGTACADGGGTVCNASGACIAKSADGLACTAGTECTSGNCVGDICCNTACAGTCKACTMALTGVADGTCSDITPGTAAPTGQCTAAPPCGNDGKCATGGTCEQVAALTTCGSASCSNGQLTSAGTCDGVGACGAGVTAPCTNLTICASATACEPSCTTPADCEDTGALCVGGVCSL